MRMLFTTILGALTLYGLLSLLVSGDVNECDCADLLKDIDV